MRHQKVRLQIAPGLRDWFESEVVVAYVPLGGTVRDLIHHLEDAYPTRSAILRICRVDIDGRRAGPGEVIPPSAETRLAPSIEGGGAVAT